MADRRDYFYKQLVTDTELDAGFDGAEAATWALAADNGLVGVVSGQAVVQHSPSANLSVDVTAGVSLDPLGKRMRIPSLETVDVSVDFNGTTTAVVGGGNSKIISIFLEFARAESDPRTDGNGDTVNFVVDESFAFHVVQGAEGASPAPPALDGSRILLADITLAFGGTTVVTGDISVARRQDVFVQAGSPQLLRRGKVKDALADLLGFYNAHVSGSTDKHADTVITSVARAGSHFGLSSGSAGSQLAAIQSALDGIQLSGLMNIPIAANVAALRAVSTSAGSPLFTQYAVKGVGLYLWDSTSAAGDDGLFTLLPTDNLGAGRWLFLGPTSLGVNGLLRSDNTGRLAKTALRNGLVDELYASATALSLNSASATYADVTGLTVSLTGVTGDIVYVWGSLGSVTGDGSTDLLQARIRIVDTSGPTNHDLAESVVQHQGVPIGSLALVGRFVLTATQNHTVKLQYGRTSGAGNVYINGPASLLVHQIRP